MICRAYQASLTTRSAAAQHMRGTLAPVPFGQEINLLSKLI